MSHDNLTKALKIVLADNYALYLKTHNYHWNVEGGHFFGLHNFFEEQYTELAEAVDEIAETIRQLGQKAPGSFKQFAELTTIQDGNEKATAKEMLTDLETDQVAIMQTIELALNLAKEIDDEATIGVLVDRLSVHRKTQWMLASMNNCQKEN